MNRFKVRFQVLLSRLEFNFNLRLSTGVDWRPYMMGLPGGWTAPSYPLQAPGRVIRNSPGDLDAAVAKRMSRACTMCYPVIWCGCP